MSVFQVMNGGVLVMDGSKSYMDTLENFQKDSGLDDLPEMVVYDTTQEACVVDGNFLPFPSETCQGYISNLQSYLDAQSKREYVAPATPTVEEQKAALKADYDSAVKELSDSMAVALLSGDATAQESIRSDFKDLQEQYKGALENVQDSKTV